MAAVRRWRASVGVAVVAIVVGIVVTAVESALGFVTVTLLGIFVLIMLVSRLARDPHDESIVRYVMRWTMVAFASRVLVGIAVTNVGSLASYLGADAITYHQDAAAIVAHWSHGFPMPDLATGKEGYYYLLAVVYWLFGAHAAAGLALNGVFAAALVPITFDTTRRLFGTAAARFGPPLVVLVPGVFVWTSQLLKEPLALFLIAVAINAAIRVTQRVSLPSAFVLGSSVAALLTVRSFIGLTVAAGLLAGITLGRRSLLGGVSTGAGAVSMIAMIMLSSGLGYAGYQNAVNTDLKQANTVRQDLSTTASGFAHEADISTFRSASLFLPRGVVTFALGPFPWRLTTARQLPALADVLVWWMLLPSLWRGLVRARRLWGRRLLAIVMPVVTTALLLSLSFGNYGVLVRERTQIVVMLVPLIAFGLAERTAQRLPTANALAIP